MALTIIRVFPRRTKWTPTDDYAFVGDPPLIRPEADEVHVSCTFTWDAAEAERLQQAWGQYYSKVKLGGPAYASLCDSFEPGQYIRAGVTFTTRGCNNRCPWCLVLEREGRLRILDDVKPGNEIEDNNLLQAPQVHINKVWAMIRKLGKPLVFRGGLDPDLLTEEIAEDLRGLKIRELYLACDTDGALKGLRRALGLLKGLDRNHLRCYVLLAFNGETVNRATAKLEAVWEAGAMPFAQLYQPPGSKRLNYSAEWRHLARMWSRPAAMKAMHHD